MPSPPPRVRQAGLVAITGYEELSSLFSELQARPDLAKQIRAVEYSPDEDTRKEPQCAADITYVLNQITQRSQLEYFKWTDPYRSSKDDLTRPEAFWMALANAAGTLKHLSLTFATHELHRLSPMIPFPSPFERLQTLHLNLGGGHGDDASSVQTMLNSIHKLTSLSLELPNCDLETCRVQGMKIDYDFPDLASFYLRGALNARSGLPDFLLRHPSITTLSLSISSDDDMDIDENALPNLCSLALDSDYGASLLMDLFDPDSRRIKHLRIDGLYERTREILAGNGEFLHCLEISTTRVHDWRTDPKAIPLAELLPSLPELREICLSYQSGCISIRNEDGEWWNPDPLDVDDLRRLLSCLPSTTQIRAVRMIDWRGVPLPADFLTDLSEVVPPSLEYIAWDISERRFTYKLEKTVDGRIEAKEIIEPIRPVRPTSDADAWTGESVLDHMN